MRSAGAAALLSLIVACGGGGFPPPVVAQQPPDAVRGLRVVLEPGRLGHGGGDAAGSGYLGSALKKAFTDAGFDVIGGDSGVLSFYDFVVGYGVQPNDGVWFITLKPIATDYFRPELSVVASRSWESRYQASRGDEVGGARSVQEMMKACFTTWHAESEREHESCGAREQHK